LPAVVKIPVTLKGNLFLQYATYDLEEAGTFYLSLKAKILLNVHRLKEFHLLKGSLVLSMLDGTCLSGRFCSVAL
jgi:hypothetical protein